MTKRITLERTYTATLHELWEMWTTKEGIESWWGPDGFRVEVTQLDLRVGGITEYLMIADSPAMEKAMREMGMPLRSPCRLRYTEITPHVRLVYLHATDFIPGVPAYDVTHAIEFHAAGDEVRMVLSFDPMHDDAWTQRATAGWTMELGKLGEALKR